MSTGASSAISAISSASQSFSGSSLKRRSGYLARRLVIGSVLERESSSKEPSRVEQTNVTGRISMPSASCSGIPCWRSARSSAADSNAQRR